MKKFITIVLSLMMLTTLFLTTGCIKDKSKYLLTIGYEKGGLGSKWIETAVKKFCEKEGYNFSDVQIIGEKGYSAGIESKLDSNTEIKDVIFSLETTQMKWAAQGWLEPLDDVYTATLSSGKKVEDVIGDGYKDSSRLNNKYGDHYYTIPWTESCGGIYYNKTMFKEKNWEIPTTFEGLVALCRKIYRENVSDESNPDKKIHPFVCSQDITSYWDFLVQNWWVQVIGIDEYNNFCKYESAEIYNPEKTITKGKLDALNAFQTLVADNKQWCITDSADYMAAQMLFAQGKVAMVPNGAWIEAEMSASLPEGIELSLMPTPFLSNAIKDVDGNFIPVNFTCANDAIIIPKAAKHKDVAKKFVTYMFEDSAILDFIKDTGTPRPVKNIDYSSIESNLTTCQKSVLNVWKNSKNFSFKTTTPLATLGLAQVWKLGMPYSKMLYPDTSGKTKSSLEILQAEYFYVNKKWNDWLIDAGVKK